jgi:carbamoyl-phosphate synthase / aspartate carbamoyltransferase / dihydroorotase
MQQTTIRLPGLIDPHVHLREPGGTHKEDWDSGTAAALAGGFTQVLAMPNTDPPVINGETLELTLELARSKARCDYAQFLGAAQENAKVVPALASHCAGLKMYLDQTYGPLRLDEMTLWIEHITRWPRSFPIAVHAEGRSLAAVILFSALYDRPIHICHVSRREEIIIIRKAKQKGVKVTCEVTPHHLFLTQDDVPDLGEGRSEVRPRLAGQSDREALWENLDAIDCFATDHAPHTLAEKEGSNPPPGFPGLETALPLFLTAVNDGRLSMDDLVKRMVTNPRRIFNLPDQLETWIEVDLQSAWVIQAKNTLTRCDWTPFEGWRVHGRLNEVSLRGQVVFKKGTVLASLGAGQNLRA